MKDWRFYANSNSPQVIALPSIDLMENQFVPMNITPTFLPMAVPRDIVHRLQAFHGYPFVWFVGKFLQFLLRPSRNLKKYLEEHKRVMDLQHPIVGYVISHMHAKGDHFVFLMHCHCFYISRIHVRRTDKINNEASFHPLYEYMTKVYYIHTGMYANSLSFSLHSSIMLFILGNNKSTVIAIIHNVKGMC